MPVTHGRVVMAVEARGCGKVGWGLHSAPGLLGAIGNAVIDRGGQELRQSHWRTSCPFGFSPFIVLAGFKQTCGFSSV